MKTIRDAVHGDMQFDRLELALIDAPAVQRLRGIKQLGTSNLVYPSAVHTRFEHSLGACWMTKRLLDAIGRSGALVSASDAQAACLAALLHDVTHVPFGHTFEDERRLFERHDQDQDRLTYFLDSPAIKHALDSTAVGDAVRQILIGSEAVRPVVRQLVTGTVCADLLDYLRRDARFCGLSLDYDDRLLHYFGIAGDQLVVRLYKQGSFRRDALSELVHLLQIRYTLTERVYYHHAKAISGAMISRALELALESNVIARDSLRELRDDSLLDRLRHGAGSAEGVAELIDDLSGRQLYKRAYVLLAEGFGRPGINEPDRQRLAERFHFRRDERRRVELELARRLGAPEAEVIVYCPAPTMSLKEADVPVEVEPGNVQRLSDLGHPDVDALKQKHRGLWRFYVCVRRRHYDRLDEISRWCEELIGFPNQLVSQRRGRLAF